MTFWERARRAHHCGMCGSRIEIGEPVRIIRLTVSARHDKLRCANCAGQPVPSDLPDLATPRVVPLRPRPPVRRIDVKARQYREPGEEG